MTCADAKREMAALLADGDADLRRHLAGCAACRREAEALERTLGALEALEALDGSIPPADDLFLAAVRRGHAESVAQRSRRRWRLPALTVGLAAAAALLVLLGPRPRLWSPLSPPLSPERTSPSHLERAIEADSADEDASELIGDLEHDELERVQARYGKGT